MTDQLVMLAGIVQNSIVDGPGIRMTVFTQGCPHRCPGCHNPQTHPFEGGEPASVEQLIEKVETDRLLGGVTLSGGEPFCQAAPLARFAQYCKERGLETAAYSGYTFEELMQLPDPYVKKLLGELDLLVDGRFIMEQKNIDLRFRGSANQRVLDVPKSLEANAPVWAEQYR